MRRPGSARYHWLRALVFLGQEEEALAGARELTRRQPGFGPGLLLQAAILERRKDFTGAESIRMRIAELPGNSWARDRLEAE